MVRYYEDRIQRLLTMLGHGQGKKLRENLRDLYGWKRPSPYGGTYAKPRDLYVGPRIFSLESLLAPKWEPGMEDQGEFIPSWLVSRLSHTTTKEIEATDFEHYIKKAMAEARNELRTSKFIKDLQGKNTTKYFLAVFDGWCRGALQIETARKLHISRERVRQISESLLTAPALKDFVSVLLAHRGRRSRWRRNKDRKHGYALYQVPEK